MQFASPCMEDLESEPPLLLRERLPNALTFRRVRAGDLSPEDAWLAEDEAGLAGAPEPRSLSEPEDASRDSSESMAFRDSRL